jgi:SAM-dependent methyltransferase
MADGGHPPALLRGTWRLYQPLRHARMKQRFRLPGLYARFWREWKAFNAAGGDAKFEELAPVLFDRDPSTQTGGGHYFYQDVWGLRRLKAFGATEHHDIGSRYDGFVGQATAICHVIGWDIRPPSFELPDFEFRQGSILELPLADGSVRSISCLHVAEHIGLGRYGDPIDPAGTSKAIKELARVLAPGGQLLFSMPVGRERVCFNNQRVWDPTRPPREADGLRLLEFSVVTDDDQFVEDVSPEAYRTAEYACGLYRFTR